MEQARRKALRFPERSQSCGSFGSAELDTAVLDLKPVKSTLLGQSVSSALTFLTSFTAQGHGVITIALLQLKKLGLGRPGCLLA